jgi:hypothetical protein
METTRAQFVAARSSVLENRSAVGVSMQTVLDALDTAIAATPEPQAEAPPEPEPKPTTKGKK